MNTPIVNVTYNAWKKMKSIILKSNNKHGFLFGVTSGGCNGFNFKLNLMNKNDYESIQKLKPNILNDTDKKTKLFVDPLSEIYIIGTTIDYINEDINNGIFESKFVYNVDAKKASSCGCGISFTPKNL
jgi:iron-sulfur cluster assembly protein